MIVVTIVVSCPTRLVDVLEDAVGGVEAEDDWLSGDNIDDVAGWLAEDEFEDIPGVRAENVGCETDISENNKLGCDGEMSEKDMLDIETLDDEVLLLVMLSLGCTLV